MNDNTHQDNTNEAIIDAEIVESDSAAEYIKEPDFEDTQEQPDEQTMAFFNSVVKVIYVRNERAKERVVNIKISLPTPHITDGVYQAIQRNAAQRVMQENKVTETAIKDVIVYGPWLLGVMPVSSFNNDPRFTIATGEQGRVRSTNEDRPAPHTEINKKPH